MPSPVRIQPRGLPVLVSRWERDEDFAVFPVGSKPKRVLICPSGSGESYLTPGRAYLLKIAEGWRAQQIWSELIAYRIAALVGLEVPPCFIALDETSGSLGNLVEFFYGYPDEQEPARFVAAADFMRHIGGAARTDRPHGVRTNLKICRALGLQNAVDWWGRVLAFDALIGNTDRHPENWGFLFPPRRGEAATVTFAPVFDNGASLGYEQVEAKLRSACEPARLNAYIGRGRHHCGWDLTDDNPTPHLKLCVRYLRAYPEAGAAMRSVIQFDLAEIAEILEQCAAFDVGIVFSSDRARFLMGLIEARKALILAALGG
jgi:hypothetical protein